MKVHEVFPTVVAQDRIDVHEEFKSEYFNELKTLWYDGYNNETPDNSGRCSLHLNESYLGFFQSLKRSVCRYLDLLEVDHEKLDINSISYNPQILTFKKDKDELKERFQKFSIYK